MRVKVEAINLSNITTNNLASSTAKKTNFSSSDNGTDFDKMIEKKVDLNDSYNDKAIVRDDTKQDVITDTNRGCIKKDTYTSEKVNSSSEENECFESTKEMLESQIRQVVKDVLNIDDKTLEDVMANMGISLLDLFKPEVLKEFVLQVNGGGDNVDFLTNETMMTSFNSLLQAFSDLSDDVLNVPFDSAIDFLNGIQLDNGMAEDASQGGIDISEFENVLNSEIDESIVMPEAEMVDLTEDATSDVKVVVQTENVGTVAVESEDKTISKEVSQMVEKVSVSEDDGESEIVNVDISENAENELNNSQSQSDDMSSLLFADRTMDSENASPVAFANQINVVQGNIDKVMQTNYSGMRQMQQMVDIVNQVTDSIRNTVTPDTTTLEMQLNPESLGKVYLSITASKEGMMTASFHVQSDEAKEALESQMYQLRENLEAKNIKIDSVDVKISDFSFSQSNEAESQMRDQSNKRKKKFDFDAGEDEVAEVSEESPEITRERVMRDNGGSIDYTA